MLQTCAYWGNDDQCTFCGIGVSLESGRTIARKHPRSWPRWPWPPGTSTASSTSPSPPAAPGPPTAARSTSARCAQAVKEASGLPVEVQFEPPDDLDVIDRVHDMGADTVGIHVETFDPAVLARIAPAKARTGIEGYFRAWERAVALLRRRARCPPT